MIKDKNTRQRILKSALKEFASHGFAGARMEHIAKVARINKAMIFYYFSSKEKLYQEVVESVFKKVSPGFYKLISGLPSAELFLEAAVDLYCGLFEQNADFVKMVALELIQNPQNIISAVQKVFLEQTPPGPSKLLELIDQWYKENVITDGDSLQFMLNVVSLSLFGFIARPFIEGLFSLSPQWRRGDEDFFKKRKESVLRLLKRGILSGGIQ